MTLDGARKRMRQDRDSLKREAEIVEHLRSIRNMLAALKAEMDEGVEVINIDDDLEEVAHEEVVEAAPREVVTQEEEPTVAPEAEVEAPRKEKLADFEMKMPTTEPVVEEPKKPSRGQKMGTLIGGDLFSPEDIRLAVAKEKAKKSSQEAKKQVVEQTLF